MMNIAPPSEDRIWAVISHLSALAFGMGVVLPIVGWSEQRRKSNYTAFQCLQALAYQSLGYTVWLLSYLLVMIILVIIFAFTFANVEQSSAGIDRFAAAWGAIFIITMLGLFGIYLLLPVVGALACSLGKDFRYPVLGNRLAKYLGYQQIDDRSAGLIEEHETRWIAAMGHFSVIIVLWGMLAPLTTWVLSGKRNNFLRFQSIQTLVYQAGATILFFSATFLYLFGLLFFVPAMGANGEVNLNSLIGVFGIVILGTALLISVVALLLIPLLHILGQWAGYRVLKGDNYSYPLVGRLVNKWISKHSTVEEKLV